MGKVHSQITEITNLYPKTSDFLAFYIIMNVEYKLKNVVIPKNKWLFTQSVRLFASFGLS